MNNLQIKNDLPISISWEWIKASFAIFREKPINFTWFATLYLILSTLPFMGSFFGMVAIVRILISANYVENNEHFGMKLNIGHILRQRNIMSFAIFNVGFDLILMSIMSHIMTSWGLKSDADIAQIASNSQFVYLFAGMSLFRILFFGISPAIITFNPDITVFQALGLSWKFMIRYIANLVFAVFMLLPFLLIPLYLTLIAVLTVKNSIAFGLLFFILVIIVLLIINVLTIFSFKIYKDGFYRG
ncbi:MAG: hypothetical protein PHC75_08405 [Burkholderiales bacterium]|nr:hypothetical protein [Burkholderiales bacterium]